MTNRLTTNDFLKYGVSALVLACLALFAATQNPLFIAAPFALMLAGLFFLYWKGAFFLLLFCIPPSIQLYFLNDSLSAAVPDEPLMWGLLMTTIIMFAARPPLFPRWWWRHPLVLVLVLQYLWMWVAVIFSHETLFSVKFGIQHTWLVVTFAALPALIFRTKKDFKTAFIVLLIPMLITMVVIFLRHKALGFTFLKINKAVMPLYFNRVDYGAVISMFFPLLITAYSLLRNWRVWWRIAMIGIILFFAVAIYLTFARGAMMAAVFALVIGVLIRIRKVQWVMPSWFILVAVAVMYMIHHNKYIDYRPDYNHTYTHTTFADHMIATFRGKDMSSMERLYRWVAGVRMSTDQPVTGYGPNSFYYYYKPYAVSSFRTWVSRNNEHSTTHNYFLFMLVEQGWPAMILYAILLIVFFIQAQRIYHRFRDPFYKKVTLGVAMVFAAGFINNFFSELIETHKVGALFFLCISLLVVLDRKSRKEGDLIR